MRAKNHVQEEFLNLFNKIEGTNIQKLRAVSILLDVKINTVRIWKSRAIKQIPVDKLELLKLIDARMPLHTIAFSRVLNNSEWLADLIKIKEQE
jgi:hypothetical protein